AAALGLGPGPLIGDDQGLGRRLIVPDQVALFGVRDVDPGERRALTEHGVKVVTMAEIDRRGAGATIDETLDHLLSGGRTLYVSFDADALDPQIAPGVGTPKEGGLTYRESHLVMETVSETGKLCAIEAVE